ncbi:MAG TPA: hypothetical protein VEH06_04490 [Candidatus Bathyarchaeia archaeon]|nr:hypothetical protein [Candidatus Bathyarchaeia archaeon]
MGRGGVSGSDLLISLPDSGEIVCEHRGGVVSYITEVRGPEWTFFTSKESRDDESRAGTW